MSVGEVAATTGAAPGLSRSGWGVRQAASFWSLGAILSLLLFAASAPSPLYPGYQARWHFSSITLTAIYAVYALGALTALLTTGRMSDYVGRRRVTALGLVVQLAAMFLFIGAGSVVWLFAARVLQGAATGIAAGAISAWLLDLQPKEDPRLGGLVGSIALISGLALGALVAGVLAAYAPDPLHLVFWLLVVGYGVALIGVARFPDVATRRPGWLSSIRPDIGVPPAARSLFVASAPSLIAVWGIGGLYLSLGPSLAISTTGIHSPVVGGLVIVALLGTGTVASYLVRAARPQTIVLRGSVVLILGVATTLIGVAIGSPVGLYLGSLIAGLGFGPAFSGIFRTLTPFAPPDRRGALLAAIYVVVYVAFSVPAVVAGVAVTLYGLIDTTFAFGIIAMALAATTTGVMLRRTLRPAAIS